MNLKTIIIFLILSTFLSGCINNQNNSNNTTNVSNNLTNTDTTLKVEDEYYDCPADLKSGSLSPEAYRKMGKTPPQCKKDNLKPLPTITPYTSYTPTQTPIPTNNINYNNIGKDIKNSIIDTTDSIIDYSNSDSITKILNDNSIEYGIKNPEIDDKWVKNFMTIVNSERTRKGFPIMKESSQLNNIATIRFNKMMEKPFISHYGADAYNTGEVVYYPEGFTEQEYATNLQEEAYLHWDLMVNYPRFTQYGYHIEKGVTLGVYQPCSITEIPGPNIDVKEFFSQHGCRTTEEKSMWLVIDMT